MNVPAERFPGGCRHRVKPDIIGLSGLLTLAFTSMRDTVTLLTRATPTSWAALPLIVIGGATIDEHVARYVGADHWTTDAMEGVRSVPAPSREQEKERA